MTARTNSARSAAELSGGYLPESPFDTLLTAILARIDHGKVNGLLHKCFSWMKQDRHSSIRLCGVSFLRLILSSSLGKGRGQSTSAMGEGLSLISTMMKEEVSAFEEQLSLKGSGKVEKQWNEIFNQLDQKA